MQNQFVTAAYAFLDLEKGYLLLRHGSRLLLYTDGLLEAGDSLGQFFGEEQVRQTLLDAAALTAEDCATLLVDRVRQWTGNRQDDDLTLIVIDVHA
jgi:phosphoserine phosphatase RsbU/P